MAIELAAWPQVERCNSSTKYRYRRDFPRAIWTEEAERLFIDGGTETDDFRVQAVAYDHDGLRVHVIRSAEKLRRYLKYTDERLEVADNPKHPRAVFIFLIPIFAWGRLCCTEAGCQYLFSMWETCPEMLSLLRVFGLRSFADKENYSGWHLSVFADDDNGRRAVVECCYSLKYADHHDDTRDGTNPWSMRSAVVWQRFDTRTLQNKHIVIRESNHMELELRSILQGSAQVAKDFASQWLNIHILYFNSIIGNLTRFYRLVISSPLDGSSQSTHLTSMELNAAIKDIHYVLDQLLRAGKLVSQNIEVISAIATKSRKIAAPAASPISRELVGPILDDLRTSSSNIIYLTKRARNVSHQLQDTISLRNSSVSLGNSSGLLAAAGSANQSSKEILSVSHKTAEDALRTRIITLTALIFVPASFIADFLQMGYVSVAPHDGFEVIADKGIWLWVVFAIPLIISMLLILRTWEFMERQRQRQFGLRSYQSISA